jgi:C1A family cysteine protease
MNEKKRFFGWRPDKPDQRDHLYAAPFKTLRALPTKVNLCEQTPCFMPDVYDQGELGSCTANAIGAAFEFELKKQHLKIFMPARLFIYYNERAMEGTVDFDSGAEIRDGIKSVAHQGVCPETEWAYDISKFTVKPPPKCYKDALKDKVIQYSRVAQTLNQLKGCLASGYPFVFGFTVYESFDDPKVAKTGIAPMPGPTEKVLGGHAVLAVGYDDAQQRFIVRNSWGVEWGMKGNFSLPYGYLTVNDLSDDFWTIRLIKGEKAG